MKRHQRKSAERVNKRVRVARVDEPVANPVAVTAIVEAASMRLTPQDLPDLARDILAPVLLTQLATQLPPETTGKLEFEDGWVVPVRPIDFGGAGAILFARAVSKLGNQLLERAAASGRIFNPSQPPQAAAMATERHSQEPSMTIPTEIKQLIAVAAHSRGSAAVQPRMKATKKKPANPQHPESVEKAKPAAVAVFEWLNGPVGQELVATMKDAGTDVVPLHGYRVCITQTVGTLQVRRDANPSMGAYDQARADVSTPDDLVKVVGPEIVISIDHAIKNNRIFMEMGNHLRQLAGGGATR
jgi:hypothetical protein